MKRIILVSVLCLIALMLTACGGKEEAKSGASAEAAQQTGIGAAQAETTVSYERQERPVDLDLTKISGTVVYSQVYDMIMEPDAYTGKRVKMKGNFSYYKNPETQQEYFAAIIADATACCAQGIEFIWNGEHSYPRDYPPLDTQITVTGTFNTYYEGDYMYVQLTDADVSW